jgi:hypothetical protein
MTTYVYTCYMCMYGKITKVFDCWLQQGFEFFWYVMFNVHGFVPMRRFMSLWSLLDKLVLESYTGRSGEMLISVLVGHFLAWSA